MKVQWDEQAGVITFLAVSGEEHRDLFDLTRKLKPSDKMGYNGRTGWTLKFFSGEKGTDPVVYFAGSDEADTGAIQLVRNMCFTQTGGLFYLGAVSGDVGVGVQCTGGYCVICSRTIIDALSCTKMFCEACRKNCKHSYVDSLVSGKGTPLAKGRVCKKCGRVSQKTTAYLDRLLAS